MTDMIEHQAEEAVGRGIDLLDRLEPDWRKAVDPTRLDLGDTSNCVFGQLYGSFYSGNDIMKQMVPGFEPRDYGFDIGPGDEEAGYTFGLLDAVWSDRL